MHHLLPTLENGGGWRITVILVLKIYCFMSVALGKVKTGYLLVYNAIQWSCFILVVVSLLKLLRGGLGELCSGLSLWYISWCGSNWVIVPFPDLISKQSGNGTTKFLEKEDLLWPRWWFTVFCHFRWYPNSLRGRCSHAHVLPRDDDAGDSACRVWVGQEWHHGPYTAGRVLEHLLKLQKGYLICDVTWHTYSHVVTMWQLCVKLKSPIRQDCKHDPVSPTCRFQVDFWYSLSCYDPLKKSMSIQLYMCSFLCGRWLNWSGRNVTDQ